jgi:5-methylcytosine-specific restriction enzyme subunit McrC
MMRNEVIRLPEYGRLRVLPGDPRFAALQALDEQLTGPGGSSVLDWSRRGEVRATSWVGVIQVDGLTIEVLPKIDSADGPVGRELEERAQRNLLVMLAGTGRLPCSERELAAMGSRRMPIHEILIQLFSRRLLAELRRGPEQDYVVREEDLGVVRGRILVHEQVRHNSANQERVRCAFDSFEIDCPLNRILRTACGSLIRRTSSWAGQQALRECLAMLGDVRQVHPRDALSYRITFNRRNQRFEKLVGFARQVLEGESPDLRAGVRESFTFLIPMERLFEDYIGSLILQNAPSFGYHRRAVRLQAKGRGEHLLEESTGKRWFQLRPDILIDGPGGAPAIILDTKWKRLKDRSMDARNGIAQSDLYQLFAYAKRYGCQDNVLLYPKVSGVEPRVFRVPETDGAVIRTAFVDVQRDLRAGLSGLVDELRLAIDPLAEREHVAPMTVV